MYSHYLVSVRSEEAVTLIAFSNLPLATVMSHCMLKCCRGWVCVSVHVCRLQFCKNRWEVEHPSNALLTLLSFFLCCLSDLFSVLFVSSHSTTLTQSGNDSFHWVFSSNGRCSPTVPPREVSQIYTDNSSLSCSPRFIYVSGFNLNVFLLHVAPHPCSLVSYKVQPLALLFGLLCTHLGRLGFLFNECIFVLTEESGSENRRVSWGKPSLPDARITNK